MSSGFVRAVTFLFNVSLIRILSQDEFGKYSMLRSFVAVIETMFTSSVGISIVLSGSKTKSEDGLEYQLSLVRNVVLLNILLLICAFVLFSIFETSIQNSIFLGDQDVGDSLYIALFLLFTSSMSYSLHKLIIGIDKIEYLTKSSVIAGMVFIPIAVLYLSDPSIKKSFIALSIFFGIDALIKLYLLRALLPIINLFSYSVSNIGDSVKYLVSSRIIVMSVFVPTFYFWVLRVLVLNDSGSYMSIAIYDTAYQFLTMASLVTGATSMVALRSFGSLRAESPSLREENLLKHVFINQIVPILFVVAALFFGEDMMGIFGPAYAEESDILLGMSIMSVLVSFSSVFHKYFIAEGLQWNSVFGYFIGALIGLSMLFMDIYPSSEYGLLIGSLVFYGVTLLCYLTIFYVSRVR